MTGGTISLLGGCAEASRCRAFSKFCGSESGIEFAQHDFLPTVENDTVIAELPHELPIGGSCDVDKKPWSRGFWAYVPAGPKKAASDDRSARTESSAMTVHASKLLTPEEFASLIEVAVSAPDANIPPAHLAKLVSLDYVAMTAKGPIVTGDGLVRITESE